MNKDELKQGLQEYFSPNGENKRFFDATQIPRICQDIKGIHESINEVKDVIKDGNSKYASKLTEKIVYGAVAMILIAVLSALIYLVVVN